MLGVIKSIFVKAVNRYLRQLLKTVPTGSDVISLKIEKT